MGFSFDISGPRPTSPLFVCVVVDEPTDASFNGKEARLPVGLTPPAAMRLVGLAPTLSLEREEFMSNLLERLEADRALLNAILNDHPLLYVAVFACIIVVSPIVARLILLAARGMTYAVGAMFMLIVAFKTWFAHRNDGGAT